MMIASMRMRWSSALGIVLPSTKPSIVTLTVHRAAPTMLKIVNSRTGISRDAGNRVGERADDGNEAREDDRLRAVPVEVVPRLVDVLLLEQSRVRPAEQSRAGLQADEVAGLGTDDGGDEEPDEDDAEVDVDVELRLGADGRHEPGQHQQRVAREEEADHQTGLGEHDAEQAEDPERLEQALGVDGTGRQDGREHSGDAR